MSAFGSAMPHTPLSMASPGAHARNISGWPFPCMTGRTSRTPSRDSRRSSGHMRSSSASGANPLTTACGGRGAQEIQAVPGKRVRGAGHLRGAEIGAPSLHAGAESTFFLEDQRAIGHHPLTADSGEPRKQDNWQSRLSRAGDDPAWSLLDVGGRRVSEATASVRDSSRADLIGPRVVYAATHSAALPMQILCHLGKKSMCSCHPGTRAARIRDPGAASTRSIYNPGSRLSRCSAGMTAPRIPG